MKAKLVICAMPKRYILNDKACKWSYFSQRGLRLSESEHSSRNTTSQIAWLVRIGKTTGSGLLKKITCSVYLFPLLCFNFHCIPTLTLKSLTVVIYLFIYYQSSTSSAFSETQGLLAGTFWTRDIFGRKFFQVQKSPWEGPEGLSTASLYAREEKLATPQGWGGGICEKREQEESTME